jgi:predicted acylesterase/phospholipase RssA
MEKREITDAQLEEMIAQYKQVLSADRELMRETAVRRLSRKYQAHKATGEPFVYEVLILSGGGAKGAFGAGFLEGWGEIESGPFERPEFDLVTGVSTGALLAPFVFLGTDEAYASAADFYANPEPNWVKKRGMIKFMPGHIFMFNNCHLQDTIREAIDPSMIEGLAKAAEDDQLLLIGTTNLDVGAGRVFNLGEEARRTLENPAHDRVAQVLLASSAIPGAFPPVDIEGMLYADGGATSNLFMASFPGPDGAVAQFKAEHPEAPLPEVRVWIIVNQRLKPQHAVTQPKWISISGRALDTLTSSSQLFALGLIKDMVHEARTDWGVEAELHMVSIPDDAPKPATKEMFDQEWMIELEDLGWRMGADPSSWTETIPSAYQVEGEWLGSD